MIRIVFEIAGKPVDPQKVTDPVQKGVYVEVEKALRTALGSVRCPDHGKEPTVIVSGSALDQLKYEVTGCCDKLILAVKKQLATS